MGREDRRKLDQRFQGLGGCIGRIRKKFDTRIDSFPTPLGATTDERTLPRLWSIWFAKWNAEERHADRLRRGSRVRATARLAMGTVGLRAEHPRRRGCSATTLGSSVEFPGPAQAKRSRPAGAKSARTHL